MSGASTTLSQSVKSIATKPVELTWKGIKRTSKNLWDYGKGAIAETFGSVPKSFNRLTQGFKESFPKLANALGKTKDSIISLFGAGKETGKGVWNITSGIAGGIGEIFKGTAKGFGGKPIQSLFKDSTPTPKAT